MAKLEELRDMRTARTDARYSLATLALKTGIDKGDLSRFESGVRALPKHHAQTLAGVLKSTNADTLLFGNRAAIVEKAIADGDPAAVMVGAQSAYKLFEGKDLDATGEQALEELMESAERFMHALAKKSYAPQPGEEGYGYEPGRNALGHRVTVEKAAESRQPDPIWGNIGGGGGSALPSPEEYLAAEDDGRDPITGHRVAPFEIDDEDEDYYDEEEYE